MRILEDIVSGMMYLHSSVPPILHNDLKSANVLIGNNISAKIADFGLSTNTRSSGFLGTLFWMAPELFVKVRSCNINLFLAHVEISALRYRLNHKLLRVE